MREIRPDPRISNHPPDWLPQHSDWGEMLQGMSREDVDWLGDHWRMAADKSNGGTWMTQETIGHPDWALRLVVAGCALYFLLGIAYCWWNTP